MRLLLVFLLICVCTARPGLLNAKIPGNPLGQFSRNPFVRFLANQGYKQQSTGLYAKPDNDIQYRTKHDAFNSYIQGFNASQGMFLQTFMHNLFVEFNETAWLATFARYNYTV